MDRKTEIKKDLFKILNEVYGFNNQGPTVKQEEFFDKVVNYLDANISLRRKVKESVVAPTVKDIPNEQPI